VSGYEEVIGAAQNWEAFSSAHGLAIKPSPPAVRNLPVEADSPEQRAYKRLVNPYFTPAAVARFEQPTRELVTRLIDDFIDAGSCEFMDAFARPLPGGPVSAGWDCTRGSRTFSGSGASSRRAAV